MGVCARATSQGWHRPWTSSNFEPSAWAACLALPPQRCQNSNLNPRLINPGWFIRKYPRQIVTSSPKWCPSIINRINSRFPRCILHARTMGYHTVYTDHSLFGFADAACIHAFPSVAGAWPCKLITILPVRLKRLGPVVKMTRKPLKDRATRCIDIGMYFLNLHHPILL